MQRSKRSKFQSITVRLGYDKTRMAFFGRSAALRTLACRSAWTARPIVRSFCQPREGAHHVHFRNTVQPHPLGVQKKTPGPAGGEWVNPTVNHVWSEEEIDERLSTQPRHQPKRWSDHACRNFLRVAYWTFNKVTGYKAANPSTDSVAFR